MEKSMIQGEKLLQQIIQIPKNALFPDLNDFCEKLHSKRSFCLTHSTNSSIN